MRVGVGDGEVGREGEGPKCEVGAGRSAFCDSVDDFARTIKPAGTPIMVLRRIGREAKTVMLSSIGSTSVTNSASSRGI